LADTERFAKQMVGAFHFVLRPAVEQDFPAIKKLINDVRINPIGLDWRRFIVAETPEGQFAGCGQLKPHGDGSVEMASIAVAPALRGQGLASAIIRRLVSEGPRPLYLTCRSTLGNFYPKFGFRIVEKDRMPRYFRRLSRIAGFVNSLHITKDRMLVMVLES